MPSRTMGTLHIMGRPYLDRGDHALSMQPAANSLSRPDKRDRAFHGIWVAVFALFVCISGALSQQPSPVTIRGRVLNPGGVPIADVPVRLEHAGNQSAEVHTGSDGNFTFHDLVPGDYTVVAEHAGLRSTPVT